MDLNLKGRRAVVTGASKGVGAATAEALAEEGCHVQLVARDAERLAELAKSLSAAHGVECTPLPADLRKTEDIQRVAEAARDADILINNAGDIPGGALDRIDEATWRHAWELKVFGYVNLTRLVYASMAKRGGGVILNVIGAGGESLDYHYIAGAAGNASLMAFTRAMGGRSLKDGIRVAGINPGPVETDRMVSMLRAQALDRLGDPDRYRELMTRFSYGRGAHPREIADALVFLASDRSAYTTGVILTIDGGLVSRQGNSPDGR